MGNDYLTEWDYYGVKIPSKSNFGRLGGSDSMSLIADREEPRTQLTVVS